jgi:hypothetical protein
VAAAELGLVEQHATMAGWAPGSRLAMEGCPVAPEQLDVTVIDVPNPLVVVDEGVVADATGRVVVESLKARWAMDRARVLPLVRREVVTVDSDVRVAVITNPAQRRSYGHWLLDGLARLVVLQEVLGDEPIAILVSGELRGAYRRSLEVYLPPHYRCIDVPGGTIARLPSISIPRFLPVPRSGALPPGEVSWFRDSLPPELRPQVPASRRLYLRRAPELDRKLVNEPALIDALIPLGFEVVQPELLTFDEQVLLFGEARTVVAVHGSALTNILFSPPGATVAELFPQGPSATSTLPTYNALLAQSLGHVYQRARGTAVGDRDRFSIDVAGLLSSLRPALDG